MVVTINGLADGGILALEVHVLLGRDHIRQNGVGSAISGGTALWGDHIVTEGKARELSHIGIATCSCRYGRRCANALLLRPVGSLLGESNHVGALIGTKGIHILDCRLRKLFARQTSHIAANFGLEERLPLSIERVACILAVSGDRGGEHLPRLNLLALKLGALIRNGQIARGGRERLRRNSDERHRERHHCCDEKRHGFPCCCLHAHFLSLTMLLFPYEETDLRRCLTLSIADAAETSRPLCVFICAAD